MRADFGLAKLAGAAAGAELGVAGTPAYMPPEQSRDPAGADHRAISMRWGWCFTSC